LHTWDTGAQWGDEGKGKLVDVLAPQFDLVARFNGGNNAGHTLVIAGKKYAFHLLPCGLAFPHTVNLLGNGVAVHLQGLFSEMDDLTKGGDIDCKGRLKVSDRAHVLFKFHQDVDGILEAARGKGGIGTTKKGMGPLYSSKATRNSVRVGDLVDWDMFTQKYAALADAHESMYADLRIDRAGELDALKLLRERMLDDDMIVDGTHLAHDMLRKGKRILCEGANAVMLDLDHGTYPYVTSSSTSAGGVCTGLGLPPTAVECTVGVVKAYTTRVGAGPFPTELTDDLCGGMLARGAPGTEIGRILQTVGAEVGVTTGRKRRCGWLDAVVLRYSHAINGYASLNLTKLDVLDSLDEVRIGVEYELNGKSLPAGAFPARLEDLGQVKVRYETMPGWKRSIAKCKTYDELPAQARAYVERIEELVGVPVSWIGVGPGRVVMVEKKD
jgi:adenylosuccinate synthase